MIEIPSRQPSSGGIAHIGSQPIALAAAPLSSSCSASAASRYGGATPATPRSRTASSPPASCRPAQRRLPSNWSRKPRVWKHPAGIDRPVAGGAGPVADRQTPARRPTGRYQAAVGAGFRADRGGRGSAAFLRQRPGSRCIGRAVPPQQGGPHQIPSRPRPVPGLTLHPSMAVRPRPCRPKKWLAGTFLRRL